MTPNLSLSVCTGAWTGFRAKAYQLVRYDFCLSYLVEILRQEV